MTKPDTTPATVPAPVAMTSPLAEPEPLTVDLDPVTAAWHHAIAGWDAQIDDIKAKREQAVKHIQAAMGDATEARIDGITVVTWRPSKPSRTLDRKALERDFGVQVIEGYLRESKPARPFRLTGKDGK
jgi:hypothetical protein